MRSHNGAVQQDIFHIWIIGELLMHVCPHAMRAPPRKAFVDRVPMTMRFRKQAPLRTAAQDPQNRFHELPAVCFLTGIGPGMLLQKCVDLFPLIVMQFGICHAPILPQMSTEPRT
jgi:hypothetical protein